MHLNVWHVAFTTSDVSTGSLPGWLEGSIKPSNMKAINKLSKKTKKKCSKNYQKNLAQHIPLTRGLWSWSTPCSPLLLWPVKLRQLTSYGKTSLSAHVCSFKQPLKFWGSSNTVGNLYIPLLNYWSWRFHLYTSPENTEMSIKLLHFSLVEVRSPCAALQLP